MGLFSSKYRTTVGTAVSRVIEDEALPQSVKTGSIKSFFNDGNIPDYVMEELVASIGIRAERMYTYAEDHYTHGLPSGEVYSSTQGRQQVEAVIEAQEGQQVLIDYVRYGPPNTLHIGWMKLISQHGYNTVTNELGALSTLKGHPVYLHDMVVVVPESQIGSLEAGALEQWGTAASAGYTPERPKSVGGMLKLMAPSPVHRSATANDLHLLVTYVWKTSTSALAPLNTETFTIPVAEYDDEADYFHAKYTVNGQAKYWIYKNKSGWYPTLDAVFVDGPAVAGSYFPFIYFRHNKQSVISNTSTDAYLTSKKMLKYLGMDYDLLAETIDDNPDIADVEQAMMVFAVPPVSTNPIENRYLFDYFDAMHYAMDGSELSEFDVARSRFFGSSTTKNTTVIKDSLFKMALGNDGIYKRMVAGTIGEVGTYSSSYEVVDAEETYFDPETDQNTVVTVPSKTHRYRHQVAPGLYEEVLVRNLKMTYYVFENYTTTGDETDDILLIPIDKTVSQNYSIADRETLYARSMHFVFNSRVVTKVKWYQTGVFKALLIIIAIVITIYTYGADGGSSIAAALGLSGTAGLIATIVVNLAIGQLLAVGFKLFVKAFGPELATALAIIAIVYGGYQIIQSGGVAGAPWAQTLLQISTGLQQAVIADKFEDLLAEAEGFNLFVEEQTKLLEKSQDLLDKNNVLSPFVIFGEAPEDFYNRTVHSGNIGILGINAISSYVDVALTLPKLKDTLGEEAYG